MDENLIAFNQIEKELEERYPGHIAAIFKGKLIAVGKNYREALERAWDKVGKKKIFLHRIGPYKEAVLYHGIFFLR